MTVKGYPSREAAHAYLDEAAGMNPGPWVQHSRNAALAAESIARHIPGMDAEKAYILALLHDIGRREGVHKDIHTLHGYDFLMRQGFPGPAQVCLTHSYWEGVDVDVTIYWDGTPEQLDRIRALQRSFVYDDYDLLVRLADALAMHDGFHLIEQRLLDVAIRYGIYENTLFEWRSCLALKDHFSALIGRPVYDVLPQPLVIS